MSENVVLLPISYFLGTTETVIFVNHFTYTDSVSKGRGASPPTFDDGDEAVPNLSLGWKVYIIISALNSPKLVHVCNLTRILYSTLVNLAPLAQKRANF